VVIDPVALHAELAGQGRGVDQPAKVDRRRAAEQLDHADGDRLDQL
jgi:hypothetical protein